MGTYSKRILFLNGGEVCLSMSLPPLCLSVSFFQSLPEESKPTLVVEPQIWNSEPDEPVCLSEGRMAHETPWPYYMEFLSEK